MLSKATPLYLNHYQGHKLKWSNVDWVAIVPQIGSVKRVTKLVLKVVLSCEVCHSWGINLKFRRASLSHDWLVKNTFGYDFQFNVFLI